MEIGVVAKRSYTASVSFYVWHYLLIQQVLFVMVQLGRVFLVVIDIVLELVHRGENHGLLNHSRSL